MDYDRVCLISVISNLNPTPNPKGAQSEGHKVPRMGYKVRYACDDKKVFSAVSLTGNLTSTHHPSCRS